MSLLLLKKEKPSTWGSSFLMIVLYIVFYVAGSILFIFGLLLLADSQVNFLGMIDYIQALDAIRDEQSMESAKRIKLVLGLCSMMLGMMFFISIWIMKMVVRRNQFIDKVMDELDSKIWSDGEVEK